MKFRYLRVSKSFYILNPYIVDICICSCFDTWALLREVFVSLVAGIVVVFGKLLQLLIPESRSAEAVDSSQMLSTALYRN